MIEALIPKAVRVVDPTAADVTVADLAQGLHQGGPMLCVGLRVKAGAGNLVLEDGTGQQATVAVSAGDQYDLVITKLVTSGTSASLTSVELFLA